ncbi:MAG: ATP-binding protein [Oscillospiraceae bacterium]|nr:ATP-binding protein [Oscillospiraceae bacterium]
MITNIQWDNDLILGDLNLSFTKDDGTPYKTIVLAGENGTGKTRILQTIATFLNLGTIEPFKSITYDIGGEKYTITPRDVNASIGFHDRTKEGENTSTIVSGHKNDIKKIKEDILDIRHYGCAYSKARSGFNTKPVKSTTTQQLDADSYDNDDTDDFTSIKQLIVDVKAQDNSSLDKLISKGEYTSYEDFHRTSKIFRFENAFNNFFDTIKFEGVDEEATDEKKVTFSKNEKNIAIDDLSTGEKQIVFRGAQLLKNSKNLNGGIVLIDEPELSMHPKWQSKVFDYYTGLFSQGGTQMSQIFFATHSENVIQAATKDLDNTLIIILSSDGGVIKADKMSKMVLPTATAAEINYLAFGVHTVDYHIALYGDFQLQTGKSSIAAADAEIEAQPEYVPAQHEKIDAYGPGYKTLPTYIRNKIDHPDSPRVYTEEEFEKSILLLRNICGRLRGITP